MLAAAGGTGTVGPKLDGANLTEARVRRFVANGGKGMVAYGDRLSTDNLDAVIRYVVTASRAK